MTLEVLFAREGQGKAFLLMMVLGAALPGLIWLSGKARRANRAAGYAGDAVTAGLFTLGAGQMVLWTGALRAYGLLGVIIGSLLAAATFRGTK